MAQYLIRTTCHKILLLVMNFFQIDPQSYQLADFVILESLHECPLVVYRMAKPRLWRPMFGETMN